MKRCLCPARLLRLDRRSSLPQPLSSLRLRPLSSSLRHGLLSWRPSPGRRQWGRRRYSSSSGPSPPPFDRSLLEQYARVEMKKCPVDGPRQSDPEAWMSLLEQYLPPSLRRHSEGSVADTVSDTTPESFAQTIELNNLLRNARAFGNLDLLAHLGFRMNNWPAVYSLLARLLDAADALKEVTLPLEPLSKYNWSYGSSVSLDQLTEQSIHSAPPLAQMRQTPQISNLTSLDSFTERPYADDHSKRIMAEVWQSLGSIVLHAADASPNESKLAMSHVFRILARLHHSGAVSDTVYKYVPPTTHQTAFRPPGMQLLSSHIMDVLSDTAWIVHEAEVAAQAAAAGQDSPFIPYKIGLRELGHEIWLEFILWCCVEHGHIREGVWLIDQMKKRTGDSTWKFQSWRPLLQHPSSVWQTKINVEDSWRQSDNTDRPSLLRKRNNPPPFNGLGKRTVSLEVAASLLDNLPNLVYMGLGFRGITASALLRHVSILKFALTSTTTTEHPLPTNKETNWLMVRVMESGGIVPEADPRAFEELLKVTPHVVPPWVNNELDFDSLDDIPTSQIYDESAALTGLIEHNVRSYASKRQCGDAINAFSWLQSVADAGKVQRIGEFFSSRISSPGADYAPTVSSGKHDSLKMFESSMPQLSPVTMADLLDLVTVSRAFKFGKWLLFSNDIDGPSIPYSKYGNQALAPSIIRFAAATKNQALCDLVLRSLSQPLSSNTLRALINFRIAMGQWDMAAFLLEYLRDFRLKSWGHSNVTALAAEIIRLDHAVHQQTKKPETKAQKQKQSLSQATDLLTRILNGEFIESHPHTARTTFQRRSLYDLQRVFLSIPGALRDTVRAANTPPKPNSRTAIPYIPITAFHTLLAAVVDMRGSAAGKLLWERWCLDLASPSLRQPQEGGVTRLYLNKERTPASGDPHFDARYFRQYQKRSVIPNINTVRILAQAAVAEYSAYEASHPDTNAPSPNPHNPATVVLNFCIHKFKVFGLRASEINREVGGFAYRQRKALSRKARKESSSGQAPSGRKKKA